MDKQESRWSDGFRRAVLSEMERQGVTRQQLADLADLTYATVSPVLAGINTGTLKVWEKIFEALDMRLSVLVRKAES